MALILYLNMNLGTTVQYVRKLWLTFSFVLFLSMLKKNLINPHKILGQIKT